MVLRPLDGEIVATVHVPDVPPTTKPPATGTLTGSSNVAVKEIGLAFAGEAVRVVTAAIGAVLSVATTTSAYVLVEKPAPLSVTLTVNEYVPEAPEASGALELVNTPPAVRVTPVGRVPLSSVHVYGPVPPVTASVCAYALPVAPAGSEAVVMVGEPGSTVT